MKEAVAAKEVENFPVPEGIVFVKINAITGDPVGPKHPAKSGKVIFECFKEGSAPSPAS